MSKADIIIGVFTIISIILLCFGQGDAAIVFALFAVATEIDKLSHKEDKQS